MIMYPTFNIYMHMYDVYMYCIYVYVTRDLKKGAAQSASRKISSEQKERSK